MPDSAEASAASAEAADAGARAASADAATSSGGGGQTGPYLAQFVVSARARRAAHGARQRRSARTCAPTLTTCARLPARTVARRRPCRRRPAARRAVAPVCTCQVCGTVFEVDPSCYEPIKPIGKGAPQPLPRFAPPRHESAAPRPHDLPVASSPVALFARRARRGADRPPARTPPPPQALMVLSGAHRPPAVPFRRPPPPRRRRGRSVCPSP